MRSAALTVLASLAVIIILSAGPKPASAAPDRTAAPAQEAYRNIPLRRDADEPRMAWGLMAVLAGLGVAVVLLAFRRRRPGAAWPRAGLARWGGASSAAQRLQVIERRGLQAGCALVLVRWDEEEILLGCAQQGISVIARRPVAAPSREEA